MSKPKSESKPEFDSKSESSEEGFFDNPIVVLLCIAVFFLSQAVIMEVTHLMGKLG